MDFRNRSSRVPLNLFPGGDCRIYLGDPKDRAEERLLAARRGVLKDLAQRGEWDVLAAIRDSRWTVEEVVRLVEEHGLRHYREHLPRPSDTMTIEGAVEEFLDTVKNQNTRKVYGWHLRRLVELVGNDTPLERLGEDQVDDIVVDMDRSGLARNTQAKFLTAGSALYTFWIGRETSRARREKRKPWITHNPFRAAKKVTTRPTRQRFLLWEEYQRLLDVVGPPLVAQYASCVWLALRPDEFITLPPEHVVLPTHVSIQPFGDWTPKGYPRSERSVGDVPVHQKHLCPLLKEYQEKWAGDKTFFVNPRTGEPWTYRPWRDQVKRDVKKAGMIYGRKHHQGITPHTFRHTVPSWMAQRDVQILKIAKFIRNTPVVAQAYYAHLLPGDVDDTLNRLF